jgi:hypothetical protein
LPESNLPEIFTKQFNFARECKHRRYSLGVSHL